MQVILVMFRAEGERRSFSIVRDVTVIGRREDCDFRIPLTEISRKHCRLIKDGDTLRAEDLGSSNGTYVNGLRIHESPLGPGDTLKVGSVVFVVQIDGVPAEDDLQPAPLASSDSAAAMAAPTDEHDLLDATAQSEAGHDSAVAAQSSDRTGDRTGDRTADVDDLDELLAQPESPSLDAPMPEEQPAIEAGGASEEYDPMSILDADPDASSVGSMLDDDQIADDLIIELDSHDQGQPNQKT